MRILFLSTAHNSLSQRAFTELTDIGHHVYIQIANNDAAMEKAVELHKPDLIIAPFLKKYIPESIWSNHTCIIIHPGIKGDRGPSSLDWAILNEVEEWGVTLLQANGNLDAGDIWATCNFPMKSASKSYLYRHEVADAAIKCLLNVIKRFQNKKYIPEKLDYSQENVKGRKHEPIKQVHRSINWSEPTSVIVKKIRSADSQPGVLDSIFDEDFYLYGAHEEHALTGKPGEIVAKRNGAICRATEDGAVWITHLKKKTGDNNTNFKLPADKVLNKQLENIPELLIDDNNIEQTYKEIWYEEKNKVGYLYFEFYNGAMSTDQCIRLKDAFVNAKKRDTRVLVLMGGADFWSNGIHLNVIEASDNPADESWKNINAINDLIKEIILTDSHLVFSAIRGNAAAGGVILALAADKVIARSGVILNPHYKKMGLYGSEYWTYLLPKRVGVEKALEITNNCLPMSTKTAKKIGLIDDTYDKLSFNSEIIKLAEELASNPIYNNLLQHKKRKRNEEETVKPLEEYRIEELKQMWNNFYGPNQTYHIARHRFVYKLPCCDEM